ncbi:hypothetical protein [Paenibacillus periandrae]|uniref:hypothetical protein n=1 Tax=Paenibacillus periandrae TaxID=1761741 RepID=UPI001F08C897|nr:hypothetical protein [Paenibacillus periandrae]
MQWLVINPTDRRETLPVFSIEGKNESGVFKSDPAVEEIIVEPGEQKYIHFVISTNNDTVLTSITLLTPEEFSRSGASSTPSVESYNVGRLSILLPTVSARTAYPAYKLGAPMSFDPLSELIHKDSQSLKCIWTIKQMRVPKG